MLKLHEFLKVCPSRPQQKIDFFSAPSYLRLSRKMLAFRGFTSMLQKERTGLPEHWLSPTGNSAKLFFLFSKIIGMQLQCNCIIEFVIAWKSQIVFYLFFFEACKGDLKQIM